MQEYIYFAKAAKAHARLVQDALFSIEHALEKISANDNKYVNIFRAELIRRALIHDIDKCQDVPYQFVEYTIGSDHFFSEGADKMEYDSADYTKTRNAAYAGLDALEKHRQVNDHHPEYFDET